jgi:copper(I)-binding protein
MAQNPCAPPKFLALIILLILTSCAPPAGQGPDVQVRDAWGRPSPAVADAAAFYLVMANQGSQADRLVGGRSPACTAVELHESYQTDAGTMAMRPVDQGMIEIPARGQITLQPGGLHLMCIGKTLDLLPGTTLSLTLRFQETGEQTVSVEIRDQP